jgi:hypothetical protein
MPSLRADYYRRQADICLRLSFAASDERSSANLFDMAQRYKAKAEAIEPADAMAPAIAPAYSPDRQEYP